MASNNDIQVGVSFNMDDVGKGAAKIGATIKSAASAMGNVGSAALTGIKNLAAGIGAASTAAAAGMAAIGKASIAAYADYEQLVGGVETLFKDSAGIVRDYAQNAYETAGMSANEYMETVTSFSASLISSLGGDTEAAAKQADVAITDMADNANKMGTSLESLQYAYAGFAKQNYTMLDNLKLGYGGTKEEMQRLLSDAEALSGVHYDIENFSDVVSAIHVIQDELGIAGATAEEANKTIEGSARAMKSAWANLLVGFADESQEVGPLIETLVERVSIYLDNLMPRIEQFIRAFIASLPSIISGLQEVSRKIINTIISSFGENSGQLGSMLFEFFRNAFTNLASTISSLIPVLAEILHSLIESAFEFFASSDFSSIVDKVSSTISSFLQTAFAAVQQYAPQILDMVSSTISSFLQTAFSAIQQYAPKAVTIFISFITSMWNSIGNFISQLDISGIISSLLATVNDIIAALLKGLPDWIRAFFGAIAELVRNIDIQELLEAVFSIVYTILENLPEILHGFLDAVFDILGAIIDLIMNTNWIDVLGTVLALILRGLADVGTTILFFFANLLDNIVQAIVNTDWIGAGISIVNGLLEGLADLPELLWDAIVGAGETAYNAFIDFFRIGSPSKLMRDVGLDITQGLINGLDAKQGQLRGITDGMSRGIAEALSFDGNLSAASLNAASFSGSSIVNNNITQAYTVGSLDVTNNATATNAIDELCSALQAYSNQRPIFAS